LQPIKDISNKTEKLIHLKIAALLEVCGIIGFVKIESLSVLITDALKARITPIRATAEKKEFYYYIKN